MASSETGSTADRAVPVPVTIGRVLRFTAGYRHGAAIQSTDTGAQVLAWGYDGSGQVGDGQASQADRLTPALVAGSGSADVVGAVGQVEAGDHHTIAVRRNGQVLAWGWNNQGQIGDGTTTTRSSRWSSEPRVDRRPFARPAQLKPSHGVPGPCVPGARR